MNKHNYIRIRKKISVGIIITFYITFIWYIIGGILSIQNRNYGVHEMRYLPLNIAFLILPILGLIWVYFALKSLGDKKEFRIDYLKTYIKNLLIIISIIGITSYFIIQLHEMSISGIYGINNKTSESSNYYINIDDMKIKCTINEYNLIKQGEKYEITFEWNEYWPDKGRLKYIDYMN